MSAVTGRLPSVCGHHRLGVGSWDQAAVCVACLLPLFLEGISQDVSSCFPVHMLVPGKIANCHIVRVRLQTIHSCPGFCSGFLLLPVFELRDDLSGHPSRVLSLGQVSGAHLGDFRLSRTRSRTWSWPHSVFVACGCRAGCTRVLVGCFKCIWVSLQTHQGFPRWILPAAHPWLTFCL